MAPLEETLSAEEIAGAQESLRQLATGYQASRALHTAVRLDVFSALDETAMTAAELSSRLHSDSYATELLLSTLVAMGLVEKNQDSFVNSAIGKILLTKDSNWYQGQFINLIADTWEPWERLEDTVRKGGPVGIPPLFNNDKVRAMRDTASVIAPLLVSALDLSRVRRVLELGGGPASYALAIAQAAPETEVTVMEFTQASSITRDAVAASGLGNRVRVDSGDYLMRDLGREAYDLILFSDVLGSVPRDTARDLLKRSHAALVSEGRCVVHEFLLRDDRTGPLPCTLYALQLLLGSENSHAWSGWEVTDAMQSQGFIRIQVIPLQPTLRSLIVGCRP